ncbi:hypothetical protein N4R57_00815 [Rhodobacteraceae bacterium D3-12]|nr:hypothetical protein N4R57_00815 [Rhodobacteraceae bacterium D3-12]
MQYDLDMASPHRALFISARAYLLSHPGVVETRKPRITSFALGKQALCHLRTMPYGIDLGFLQGAMMQDVPARLTGTGKRLRVLSLQTFDRDLVAYYVKQALTLAG